MQHVEETFRPARHNAMRVRCKNEKPLRVACLARECQGCGRKVCFRSNHILENRWLASSIMQDKGISATPQGRLTARGYAGSRPVNTVQQGLLNHMRVSLLVIASKVSCLLDSIRLMMSAHASNWWKWGRGHRCGERFGGFPADSSRGFAISVFLPCHFSRKNFSITNLNACVAPVAAGDADIVKIFNTHRAKHSQKRPAPQGLCPAVSKRDIVISESWQR